MAIAQGRSLPLAQAFSAGSTLPPPRDAGFGVRQAAAAPNSQARSRNGAESSLFVWLFSGRVRKFASDEYSRARSRQASGSPSRQPSFNAAAWVRCAGSISLAASGASTVLRMRQNRARGPYVPLLLQWLPVALRGSAPLSRTAAPEWNPPGAEPPAKTFVLAPPFLPRFVA